MPTEDAVRAALATVNDPEIGKPITELGMVQSIAIADGRVRVEVLLTVPGCPMKDRITRDVTAALTPLDGVTSR
jgi:Predicted metal-sulfur cluster biosynthetic enzyme